MAKAFANLSTRTFEHHTSLDASGSSPAALRPRKNTDERLKVPTRVNQKLRPQPQRRSQGLIVSNSPTDYDDTVYERHPEWSNQAGSHSMCAIHHRRNNCTSDDRGGRCTPRRLRMVARSFSMSRFASLWPNALLAASVLRAKGLIP